MGDVSYEMLDWRTQDTRDLLFDAGFVPDVQEYSQRCYLDAAAAIGWSEQFGRKLQENTPALTLTPGREYFGFTTSSLLTDGQKQFSLVVTFAKQEKDALLRVYAKAHEEGHAHHIIGGPQGITALLHARNVRATLSTMYDDSSYGLWEVCANMQSCAAMVSNGVHLRLLRDIIRDAEFGEESYDLFRTAQERTGSPLSIEEELHKSYPYVLAQSNDKA